MTDKRVAWIAALVPYDPVSCEAYPRKAVYMYGDNSEEDQKRFYAALVKLPWLAPPIRRAIMKELGLSIQAQNREIEQARMVTASYLIKEESARLRRNGERPRGGSYDEAVTTIAERLGMSSAALTRAISRSRHPPKRRRCQKSAD